MKMMMRREIALCLPAIYFPDTESGRVMKGVGVIVGGLEALLKATIFPLQLCMRQKTRRKK